MFLGNDHDLVGFLEREHNPQLFISGMPGSFAAIFVDRGLEGKNELVGWRHQLEEFGAHVDVNLLNALCAWKEGTRMEYRAQRQHVAARCMKAWLLSCQHEKAEQRQYRDAGVCVYIYRERERERPALFVRTWKLDFDENFFARR